MPSIQELKKLIDDYNNLQNNPVENNQFIITDFHQQEILKELEIFSEFFITKANDFEFSLRETFTKHKKASFTNVNLTSKIKNININNHKFAYYIKLTIGLRQGHETFNQVLPTFAIVSDHEIEDYEFLHNQYEINLLPILLETKMQNCALIHKACWNVVMNNLNKVYSI